MCDSVSSAAGNISVRSELDRQRYSAGFPSPESPRGPATPKGSRSGLNKVALTEERR